MPPRIRAPPPVEPSDEKFEAFDPCAPRLETSIAVLDGKVDFILATLQHMERHLQRRSGQGRHNRWRPMWRASRMSLASEQPPAQPAPVEDIETFPVDYGGSEASVTQKASLQALHAARLAIARAQQSPTVASEERPSNDDSQRRTSFADAPSRNSLSSEVSPAASGTRSVHRISTLSTPRFRDWVSVGMRSAYSSQTTKSIADRERRRRVWQFLEDKQSSRWAVLYYYVVMLLIGLSVSCSMLELLFGSAIYRLGATVFEAVLVLELVVRYVVCPNRHTFWLDPYNMIDLLVFLACTLPLIMERMVDLPHEMSYALRIFSPCLLMLRYLRRFDKFQLLVSAFQEAAQAMPVLLYTLLVIAFFHSGLIFLLEPRDAIPKLNDAMWFTMTTMATVGYADPPTTHGGRAATLCLNILSALYLAIPIGIVGTAFSNIWEDRHRLLLMQQMRRTIARAGYTPYDLIKMFQRLDTDGDNYLTFDEFRAFLPMLRVTMPDELAQRIFETFDGDGEGSIDFEEFLLGVFPAHHFYMTAVCRRGHRAGVRLASAGSAGSAGSGGGFQSCTV